MFLEVLSPKTGNLSTRNSTGQLSTSITRP
jgi:hypothetical protein